MNFSKLLANKRHVDLAGLERPFTLIVVKEAVFSLGGNKALGPDGFPIHIFKKFLETIKETFSSFVKISILEKLI